MAVAARTWAQIAGGLPSSPAPEPAPKAIPKGAHKAAATAQSPGKMGKDRKAAQKVSQKGSRKSPGDAMQNASEIPVPVGPLLAAIGPLPLLAGCQDMAEMPMTMTLALESNDDGTAMGLAEAQAAKCVSDSAMSRNLVKASRVEDACQSCDLSSTAASELAEPDCILCNGSGLLCVGLLEDPCPLCEPEGETAGDEGPEAMFSEALSGTAASDVSTHDAPPEVEQADTSCPEGEDVVYGSQVVSNEPIRSMAPPGLGPPGVWVWPHLPESKPIEPDFDKDEGAVSWPQESVNSVEVEFIGKVSQLCFGSDFIKMTVSWDDPWEPQGDQSLSKANVQLHLEQMAPVYVDFMVPLRRLEAYLARDQALHGCQIFRMSCSKDNTSMEINCAMVTVNTCWDVLKKGFCPRPGCTWPHPVPILVNVSWIGGPELHLDTKFSSGKMQTGVGPSISMVSDSQQNDLNIGAYDFMSDSSDD